MKSIMIFSHDSDVDGMGSVILAHLAFENVNYEVLPNVDKLENRFLEFLKNEEYKNYDNIYITDLALYEPALTESYNNNDVRNKLRIFDHHQKSINLNLDKYDIATIKEIDDIGKKRCGTDLFYEYLVNNKLIEKNSLLDEFVEMIRLEDNWLWKNEGDFGKKAHNLALLFNSISVNEFILSMIIKLRKGGTSFEYNDAELDKIISKQNEYDIFLGNIISKAFYFIDEFGNKYAIVDSGYEYRNELPDYILNIGNPNDISYIILVALDKDDYGQKSYRSVKNGFDVNYICEQHGGGGHIGAAAVKITKSQREMYDSLEKEDGLKYIASVSFTF